MIRDDKHLRHKLHPKHRAKDFIANFAIIGNCGLGKVQVRAPSRGVKSRPGGAYNRVSNFGPPDSKEAA